jgi:hypothetical protein
MLVFNACAVQVTLPLQIQDSGKKINLSRLDCNAVIPVSVSSAGKIRVHFLFRYMIHDNGINICFCIIVLTPKKSALVVLYSEVNALLKKHLPILV